jgi:predicted dithiol-disulfide oxidoreductase (DUF899 family)
MRFPGESVEYRRARDELLEAEAELRRQGEAVAAQRRELPLGGEVPTDYEFDEWDPATGTARTVRLSQLFAPGKDTLFIYSFMFNPGPSGRPLEVPCPRCSSMIDGFEGGIRHLDQRVNVAVATKAPIERFHAHAHARGWRYARLLSSAGSTYNLDYNAEGSDAQQRPMATVFTRRDGRVRHFWSSELLTAPGDSGQDARHVDFMWPLWAALDCTPDGRGADWMPQFEYRP